LDELVRRCEPFWVAEAELIRGYFDSSARTRGTDRAWIARQCHKELFDGYVARLAEGDTDGAHEELDHHLRFAALHEALGGEPLTAAALRTRWAWPENAELAELRARHVRRDPRIGARAQRFTEGGGGALYAEGMRLRGRGGADELIAEVCEAVHADEVKHRDSGVADLDDATLTTEGWTLLTELTLEQLRARLRMRAAQFSMAPAGQLATSSAKKSPTVS
jgi:hypothetical protein